MRIDSLRLPIAVFLVALLGGGVLQACSDAATSTQNTQDDFDDEDDDDDDEKETKKDKSDDSGEIKLNTETKEKKPDTTVIRRQMTNVSDKITRAQANLQRTETLKNSAEQRLNDTKAELAKVELEKTYQQVGDVTVSNGNAVKKTKAQLQQLVKDQSAELAKWDAEIKALEDEIASYEAELDALTLKLEKK